MTLRIAERMAHDWLDRLDAAMAAYPHPRPESEDTNAPVPSANVSAEGTSEAANNDGSGPRGAQKTHDTEKEQSAEAGEAGRSEAPPAKVRTPGADEAAGHRPSDHTSVEPRNANRRAQVDGAGAADDAEQAGRRKQLRDCFVDDGWRANEGFDNPTAAMHWLTEQARSVGAVRSIDIPQESTKTSRVVFELVGGRTETVEAHIIVADRKPKCCYLKKARTGSQEGSG